VEYIIPLAEIIAELHGAKSTAGKAVQAEYHDVLARLGDEFSLLRTVPAEAIHEAGYPVLAVAIERLRQGDVVREPGYDGVYGVINVFKDASERQATMNQLALF
jgi:PHP family Zn ribbon phosphoesterase